MKEVLLRILAGAGAVGLLLMPSVAAAQVELDLSSCQFWSSSEVPCDPSIKKEVKVAGGAYVDANTPAEAANGYVGDTVTWRITVSNNAALTAPIGDISVTDLLPAGTTFVSATASNGSFVTDSWVFTVGGYVDNAYVSNLPATLELTTTANTTGLHENTADIVGFFCEGDEPCEYDDGNAINNTDKAYVNIGTKGQVLGESTTQQPKPQVLAAATLADTGTETIYSAAAVLVLIGTLALVLRRKSGYRL
jgi:uncharacterized repeat protein (TIGR01451 family)/LPXTG-motif cell wall-anchored protein